MCRSVGLIRMLMVVMQRRAVRLHLFRHFVSPRTQIFRMRRVVPLQRTLEEKRFATFDEKFLSHFFRFFGLIGEFHRTRAFVSVVLDEFCWLDVRSRRRMSWTSRIHGRRKRRSVGRF